MFACYIPEAKAQTTYTLTINAYDIDNAAYTSGTPFGLQISTGAWTNSTTAWSQDRNSGYLPWGIYGNATNSYGHAIRGYSVGGVLYVGSSYNITSWTANTTITITYSSAAGTNYNYTLNGLIDETSGLTLTSGVSVTAHFNGAATETFFINGSQTYSTSTIPMYFSYDLGNEITRQYWLNTTETTATLYITNSSLTTYTINFMDQTGILQTNPYIIAKTYVNGSLVTVEKRKVDSVNSITMNLVEGKKYNFVIEGATTYQYGEVLMTAVTSVQLVLRGVDFPKSSLLLYQYVHAYALRDFLNPIGAITISYEDVNSQTNSVQIDIKYTNGTVANTQTFSGAGNQTFSYTWNSAVNATDYQVIATVNHQTYGTFYFKQYLNGEYTKASNPFDLSFMGSISGIETAWFIPALLIIFAAACFSELTSEVACVLTVFVAILLAVIGFISISTSALVVALSFGVLAGVVSVRRRYF